MAATRGGERIPLESTFLSNLPVPLPVPFWASLGLEPGRGVRLASFPPPGRLHSRERCPFSPHTQQRLINSPFSVWELIAGCLYLHEYPSLQQPFAHALQSGLFGLRTSEVKRRGPPLEPDGGVVLVAPLPSAFPAAAAAAIALAAAAAATAALCLFRSLFLCVRKW